MEKERVVMAVAPSGLAVAVVSCLSGGPVEADMSSGGLDAWDVMESLGIGPETYKGRVFVWEGQGEFDEANGHSTYQGEVVWPPASMRKRGNKNYWQQVKELLAQRHPDLTGQVDDFREILRVAGQASCMDCGEDIRASSDYMVMNKVWQELVPEGQGFVCLDCLGSRSMRFRCRPLRMDDFSSYPVNAGIRLGFKLGQRND